MFDDHVQGWYLLLFCNKRLDYFTDYIFHCKEGLQSAINILFIGHYFIVWLMLKETFYKVEFLDPLSKEFQDAVSVTVNGVSSGLWQFQVEELI